MFSQKFIFIFIFEYPLRIISELIKILVDMLIIYYTDMHDVDENRNIIPVYSGMWMGDRATSDGTGIYRRDMYDPVDTVAHTVASLKNIGHSFIRSVLCVC